MALAIVMVVVAPLVTFVMWSRIQGPWAARATARLGMIVASQLSAILVAGLVVNDKFQLYGSWNDLLGRTNGASTIIQAAGDAGVPGGRGDSSQGNVSTTPPFTRWGDEWVTTLAGTHSKLLGDVYVWLPPQYNDPAYQHYDFPVVELFQGTPGTPRAWFATLGAATELESQVTTGKAMPFVLVAPDINLLGGRHNADCSNIPNGPQLATFLTDDVRQLITARFRVTANRAGWGVMGYSEGGYCAAKLLVQYPQDYTAGVAMSADNYASGDLLNKKANKVALLHNNVLWLVQHQKPAPIALLMAASAQDGNTLKEASADQHAAHAPTSIEILEKLQGKHNPGVWKSWLPEAFAFLSGHLAGPVRTGDVPSPTAPTKPALPPTTATKPENPVV